MATKSLTVVRPGRYGTRMLQAGDTCEVTAPEARLYAKLGWMTDVSEPAPARKAAPKRRKRRAKKA